MARLELSLGFRLQAKHSLYERETAHEHVWRIRVGVTGPVKDGRIVSMPALREAFEPEVRKLDGSFLNENALLDVESRKFPTCECLAFYFEKSFASKLQQHFPELKLTEVEVSVDELDGEQTGSVKLILF